MVDCLDIDGVPLGCRNLFTKLSFFTCFGLFGSVEDSVLVRLEGTAAPPSEGRIWPSLWGSGDIPPMY
jgi:hypothetical protein